MLVSRYNGTVGNDDVAEASRRAVGINKKASTEAILDGSIVLSDANAERIVATLCKVIKYNTVYTIHHTANILC